MTTAPASVPVELQPVVRTWKPTTAGILTIISGAIGIIIGLILIAIPALILNLAGMSSGDYYWPDEFSAMLFTIYAVMGLIAIILGIFTVIAGTFTLRRRNWGLALAGSIIAIFLVAFLGIPSIIFVAMSKNEFV